MTDLTFPSAIELAATINVAGLTVPKSLSRGIELAQKFMDLTHSAVNRTPLELEDSEVEVFYQARALRESASTRQHNDHAWHTVAEPIQQELFDGVRRALLGEVDDLIEEMREPFETIGSQLSNHVNEHGLNSGSEAADVLGVLDAGGSDKQMIAKAHALRDSRALLPKLGPYAALRRALSEVLDLSPTLAERRRVAGIDQVAPNDWSILFAAGDNWSVNGHNNRNRDPNSSLDWLALAAGGLAMNTVDQVQEKLRDRMSFLATTLPQPTEVDDDEDDDE